MVVNYEFVEKSHSYARTYGLEHKDDLYGRRVALREVLIQFPGSAGPAAAETGIEWLDRHPRVVLYGPATAAATERVPTVTFTVEGLASSELVRRVDERRLALRFGHFYALRATRALGLSDGEGVVRASLVHYNTAAEVARLVAALEELL